MTISCSNMNHLEESDERRDAAQYDLIIVGAGAAGLAAARYIQDEDKSLKFVVVESSDRVGGRARSMDLVSGERKFHIDTGATWLHGRIDHPLLPYLRASEIVDISESNPWVSGEVTGAFHVSAPSSLRGSSSFTSIEQDESEHEIQPKFESLFKRMYEVAAERTENENMDKVIEDIFMEPDFFGQSDRVKCTLRWILSCHAIWLGENFAEIDCSSWAEMANPSDACWGDLRGAHSIVKQGIGNVVEKRMAVNVPIKTSHHVENIHQTKNLCYVKMSNQNGETVLFSSRLVLVTIPISVIADSAETLFTPQLPEETVLSLQKVSFAHYLKVYLVFKEVFWDPECTWIGKTASAPNMDPLDHPFCLYFNYFKFNNNPVLVATTCGEKAKMLEMTHDDRTVMQFALEPLKQVFQDIDVESHLTEAFVTRWGREQNFKGAYPLGTSSAIGHSFDRILFAGDGTSQHGDEGSIASAITTGKKQAEMVLKLKASNELRNRSSL